MRKRMWFMGGALLMAVVCASAQRVGDAQSITEFEVPEFGPDNELKSKLYGASAILKPNGVVDIVGLRIEFFDARRMVEMRVFAETCLYNRVTRNAESKGRVRIARDKMVITGEGFNWNAEEERFRIFKDSKVVLQKLEQSMQEVKE